MANQKSAKLGSNKTGIDTSPKLSKEMIEASNHGAVSTDGSVTPEEVRTEYIREGIALGSVPPPNSIKGAAKAAVQALKGEKVNVFIDKLGERLAFERSGTRLYEAMLVKCRANGDDGSVSTAELEKICAEELKHFQMLWGCLETLGADPTVETPSADVSAVASQGLPKVLTDPRTTVAQCLEAILVAELVDNAAWELLADLAEEFGQSDMARKFKQALEEEEDHLESVRHWIEQGIRQEAQIGMS